MTRYGAVVRLPVTCWLHTNDDLPDKPTPDRAAVGLPADALVLCTQVPALMVDPRSFDLWMQMLRGLPDAVLWLPSYAPMAQRNLALAARAAGIDPQRLVFQPGASRAAMLARLSLADLFVDSVRFNANQGLVDALRMGVPAVSCAGDNMASRLGGSILRAAGLPHSVTDQASAFVDRVVELGRNRPALRALHAQLARQLPLAPLFDAAARVREWESAWTIMVQRHRGGQAPAAFDVPLASPLQTAADAAPH